MATRSEMFQLFGPKLIEAIAKELLAEINTIRTNHSLPEIETQDFTDSVVASVATIPDYDWMADQ